VSDFVIFSTHIDFSYGIYQQLSREWQTSQVDLVDKKSSSPHIAVAIFHFESYILDLSLK